LAKIFSKENNSKNQFFKRKDKQNEQLSGKQNVEMQGTMHSRQPPPKAQLKIKNGGGCVSATVRCNQKKASVLR
jgi:hypothetical protein